MTDEYKLQHQKARGERAERLMQDEFIKEAFAAVEKTINDAWKDSHADEEGQRNNAYLMYRLLRNFRQQFQIAMATGKAAKAELLQIRDPSKIRRFING